MIKEFELESIERTSQSNNLGKWMLLTNKDKIQMTRRRLAKELGRIFSGILKEEDLIGGIDVPRLTNGLAMNEKHEEYLKRVEESVGIMGDIDSVEMRVTKGLEKEVEVGLNSWGRHPWSGKETKEFIC